MEIVADIILNHIYKAFAICELVSVVPFTFENSPETFHGSVVNAVGHPGHALRHAGFFQLRMEHSVGILKSSVTVKYGMCARIRFYGGVKCVVYQRVVIAAPDHIRDDASVIEIKNGAEIDLMFLSVLVLFKLCNVRKPFSVRLVCMEIPVENILRQILRIFGISGTAVVCILDGGLYVTTAADSQGTFVADSNIVVFLQIIPNAAVTLVWTVRMDLFGEIRYAFVFFLSLGQISGMGLVRYPCTVPVFFVLVRSSSPLSPSMVVGRFFCGMSRLLSDFG